MKIPLKLITLRYFVIKYLKLFQMIRQHRQRVNFQIFKKYLEKKVNALVDLYNK